MKRLLTSIFATSFLVLIDCGPVEPKQPIGTFKCDDQGNLVQGELYGFGSLGFDCNKRDNRYCIEIRDGDHIPVSSKGECSFELNSKHVAKKLLNKAQLNPEEVKKASSKPKSEPLKNNVVDDFDKDFDF
jgi:hypothetical protein